MLCCGVMMFMFVYSKTQKQLHARNCLKLLFSRFVIFTLSHDKLTWARA